MGDGVLFLTNSEIVRLLPVAACIDIAEQAYRELGQSLALDCPRVNLALPVEEKREYVLKTWAAAYPKRNVVGVRLTSSLLEVDACQGRTFASAVPISSTGMFLGLILLFSSDTGELLAVLHDSYLSALSISVPVGLAAKHLAREDAHVLGIIGTGRQAEQQVEAIASVCKLAEVRVFSPLILQRQQFAHKIQQMLGMPVRPADTARAVLEQSDLVATATSSLIPVFEADWVKQGTHLSMTRPSEAPLEIYRQASVLVSSGPNRPLTFSIGSAGAIWTSRLSAEIDAARVVTLMDVISGGAAGRTSDNQISLYGAMVGYSSGLLYPALGAEVVQRAKRVGVGRHVPLEWFVQPESS